ncbi:MAG: N-acetylneuraminate synthase family protein [Ignavibacteriales bacterium]|nr:N-acetylneuraminate synthase family protein [Ignavibacteriales bacterium]
MREVKVGNKIIGDGHPVYIIAEIGINHNGDIEIAKQLIDGSVFAKCDAVKFQKRTPEICVPRSEWDIERDTPWGRIRYIDYRHKMEFGFAEFEVIDQHCKEKKIHWFASPWDTESVDFLESFNPIMYKVASASLTDLELLGRIKETKKPIMLSTGMSTIEEVVIAVDLLKGSELLIAQSTSCYPCNLNELNLNVIRTYREIFPNIPIGYSGHETGLAPTYAAVSLGANFVERHITLDRAMWGSDQAASVEIHGLFSMVRNIRDIEKALGDGRKKIFESELNSMKKLRRISNVKELA